MRSNLKCSVLKGDYRNDAAFFVVSFVRMCRKESVLTFADRERIATAGTTATTRKKRIFPTVDLKRRRVNRLLSKVNEKVFFFISFYFWFQFQSW